MDKAIWLARLLHRRGTMTRREILDAWCEEDACGKPMGQTTFYDNWHALESRYGIRIVREKSYYRLDEESLQSDSVLAKIITQHEDVATNPNELLVETWNAVLADAVAQKRKVQVCYASPGKKAYETILHPYALRCIQQLYYVVGYSSKHGMVRTFAVDRIRWAHLLAERFALPNDFTPDAYFEHSFGAFGGIGVVPQRIHIETSPRMADYFRGRPLHASQRELPVGKAGCVDFELLLAPTDDFIGQLMAFGPEVIVVEPTELKQKMAERHRQCLDAYRS